MTSCLQESRNLNAPSINLKIVVLGIGYVGLPLSILLAKAGYKVLGVDIRAEVVRSLSQGFMPIKETGLDEFFAEAKQNISFADKPSSADVFIISVPTPLDARTKTANLTYVVSAVKSTLPHLRQGNLIILESSIPPLTCRGVVKPLIEENTDFKVGKDIFVAHCPERVLPGNTFYELIHDNRVIGGIDPKSAEMAKDVYSSFVKGEIDLVDDVTAEMTKLMENTFRDVNIALANEFSILADTLGVEVHQAIRLANKHPRVKILTPGVGVGGHCLPKDPWLLVSVDPKDALVISTARRLNESMPARIAAKIRKAVRNIDIPKILAFGLTYKPDSDDLRESPSLEIIRTLHEDGYDVTGYDNFVKDRRFTTIRDVAAGADCIVLLVEHTEIKVEVDKFEDVIKSKMRTPLILRTGTSYKPDFYDLRQKGQTSEL